MICKKGGIYIGGIHRPMYVYGIHIPIHLTKCVSALGPASLATRLERNQYTNCNIWLSNCTTPNQVGSGIGERNRHATPALLPTWVGGETRVMFPQPVFDSPNSDLGSSRGWELMKNYGDVPLLIVTPIIPQIPRGGQLPYPHVQAITRFTHVRYFL